MFKCYCVILIVLFECYEVFSDGYIYPQPQPPLNFDEPSPPATPIYLPPPQPPLQDEIPQIIPTYLPPSQPIYPPLNPPSINDEFQLPSDDTLIIPSPPSNQYGPPSNQYLPPVATGRSVQVRVLNMSCLDSRDEGGFFRTTFRSGTAARLFPVIESAPSDCLVAPIGSDLYRIDLQGQRMSECGIRNCGTRMCVSVRMASIGGLRLAEDPLVNLQCIPQETVVAHTKHVRLTSVSEQGRSAARTIAVASGGNQRRFEPQISVLRRSSGSEIFDQPLQQGSAVRLGDELMLRASIRDNDGWKQCRMGSVIVRSATSQRSVTLVDDDGCRVPAMRTISPQQPQQISPLIVQLPFRAFLFQGAAPSDNLLLSVRMLGCLRPRDCYQSRSCDDNRARTKRFSENSTIPNNSTITKLDTEFEFQVLPIEFDQITTIQSKLSLPQFVLALLIGLIIVIITLICIIVFIVNNKKR